MRRILGASVAAWAFAGALHAAPVSGDLTADPVWLHQPTIGRIASVYPIAADRSRTSGRASMRCRINDNGDLRNCGVIDEFPAGAGFGAKTQELARDFTSKALSADGSPAFGHTVIVSIDFTPIGWARLVGDRDQAPKPAQLVRWLRGYEDPLYPFEVRKRAISARVVLHCRIMADGSPEPCTVESETPKGLGFGKAAVIAARTLLVSRQDIDGNPTAGRTIEFPMVINPPCDDLTLDERTASGCPTLQFMPSQFR
jgi:hypothetical protein